MGNVEIPTWLKGLPLAPEFRPTDTEFADPVAYISKIEKEASAFGICKIIPPLPKPSKRYVFSNLNRSLSKCPELGDDVDLSNVCSSSNGGLRDGGNDGENRAVFTTRQQELGQSAKKAKGMVKENLQSGVHKQVWQSGEAYTLEQFESKSKAFARSLLGMLKEVNPLVIEALFWKAASEKPIYVEYANDVPGSGFGEPESHSRYFPRRRRKRASYQSYRRGRESPVCSTNDTDDVKNSHNDEVKGVSIKNVPSLCLEMTPRSSMASLTSLAEDNLRSSKQKSVTATNDMEGTAGWKLSNSPWNLQVIARSPGSLTRFMPDDIPGVTSPMVYIGMLFSWFAWHVEDHELHSMNFLHTGSPKTWYAVPGDYVFSFEEVIRTEAYGGNIDRLAALSLLGEKTTLLSPKAIISSGIPCCRLVQNPGEFVVTFPRAYHVGFSHGFNCGEAANFGTPQWLKVAKEAAVRRAAMNYLPMLSHQQLLYLLTMSFVSRVPRSLLPGARSSRLRDRQREERELSVKEAFLEDMLKENDILSAFLEKNSTCHAVIWNPDLLPCASKESHLLNITSTITTTPKQNASHINLDVNSNCNENDLFKEMSLYMETLDDLYMEEDDLSCDFQVDSGTLACVACGILGFPFMSVLQPHEKASIELMPSEEPRVTRIDNFQPSLDSDSTGKGSVSDDHGPVKDYSVPLKDLPMPTGWNTSHKFLRPRIFCLEHGVQIEELLQSKGGANLLIICHSDYQKIKAHAYAIAEEIESSFNYNEVPSEAASKEDLNLINLAIDDEDHHECGEDWTSKLGINLRYCVKIRKNSPSKKVQHALALGGLFSDRSLTDFSNIKWQSRRSRSRIKLNQPFHRKPCKIIEPDKDEMLGNKSDGLTVKKEEKLVQYTRRKYKVKIDYSTNGLEGCSRRCFAEEVSGASGDDPDKYTEQTTVIYPCNIGITRSGSAGFGFSPIEDPEMLHEVKVLEAAGGLTLNSAPSQDACSVLTATVAVKSVGGQIEDQLLKESKNARNICNVKASGTSEIEHQINASGGTSEKQDFYATKCCSPFITVGNERFEMQREDQVLGNVNMGETCNMVSEGQQRVLDDGNASVDEVSDLANVASLHVSLPPIGLKADVVVENSFINNEVSPPVTLDDEVKKELVTKNRTNGDQCSSSDDTLMNQPTTSLDERCGHEQETHAVQNKTRKEAEIKNGSNDEIIPSNVISVTNLVPIDESSEFHRELHATVNLCNGMAFENGKQLVFQTTNDSNKELISCSVAQMEINSSTASSEFSKLHRQAYAENDLCSGSTLDTIVPPEIPTTDIRTVEELASNSATINQELSEAAKDICAIQDSYACMDLEREVEKEIHSSDGVTRDSEVQKIHQGTSLINEDIHVSARVILVNQPPTPSPVIKCSNIDDKSCVGESMVRCNKFCSSQEIESIESAVVDSRPTAGKGRKRKGEVEQLTENKFDSNGFIRSPCEGLRPRAGKDGKSAEENPIPKRLKKPSNVSVPRSKRKEITQRSYKCDLEGCRMSFETKAELQLHKGNRCTYDGCGKKFSSHKYAIVHQRVHGDDRPLKCPWKGCTMSFKWAWARIEHIRVHTGEKPYQCKVDGCGLSFRFVSDFSRHRRKTGHYLNTPD
ncbi:lysine-specific demethylase ELF6 isoform X2 [Populus alba]|uniref:Putative lysine-specific demethylase ELF6 n=1 Tax=Populus alba TaxID=43335 RepID=A0A4U5R2G8_POPAL|nr:probable lysine-specific demethylase ELF6 isoform X2 [Populus alba]TKS17814.1 putative lysine-specific demethylase ELF6 [Populus alba]